MPILETQELNPHFLMRSGHFNTIYSSLFRKPKQHAHQIEIFNLPDGDFIEIDAYNRGNKKVAVLLHGLEGNSKATYLLSLINRLLPQGFDVFAINMRGCSGVPNKFYHSYHSGKTSDVKALLKHLKSNFNYEKTMLIGFSLGGNIALKLAGDEGKQFEKICDVVAAFSVPCDLRGSSEMLALKSSKIYMRRFLSRLRKKMILKFEKFEIDESTRKKVLEAKTFLEFDNAYTAPAHGFKDAEDYWQQCSSLFVLEKIEVPTLLVNAKNDPFLSDSCFPVKIAEKSDFLFLDMPKFGGHCGFSQDLLFIKTAYNEQALLRFLNRNSLN